MKNYITQKKKERTLTIEQKLISEIIEIPEQPKMGTLELK